jgi:hypothetical protein
MVELRCTNCPNMKNSFCIKINEALPNDLAKLLFEGANGVSTENALQHSKCGTEKTVKKVVEQPEENLTFIVANNLEEILVRY